MRRGAPRSAAARGVIAIAKPALLLAVVALLPGCTVQQGTSFLEPAGPVSAAQQALFIKVLGLMAIVVVPVLILTPLFAWRYRRTRNGGAYRPHWEFSWPLELAIWGVPLAVVLVLALNLWRETVQLDPYRPLPGATKPLDVQVVGLDWKWLFIYPEQNIAAVNQLVFPARRSLRLHLTSDSVMQSFFIPSLGSQIYAMAGMVTQLNLKSQGEGRYAGENTQFNGRGFHQQKFLARAVSAQAFDAWVNEVRAAGRRLDRGVYGKLSDRSIVTAPIIAYGSVETDLFEGIVGKYRHSPANRKPPSSGATTAGLEPSHD